MPNLVFVLHFFNRDASAEYFFPPFSLIRPFCSNYIISGVAVFEWISRRRADGKYLLCTLRLLSFRSLQWNNIQSIYSKHEMCTGSYFVSARKHERIAMKWNYKITWKSGLNCFGLHTTASGAPTLFAYIHSFTFAFAFLPTINPNSEHRRSLGLLVWVRNPAGLKVDCFSFKI